MTVEISFSKPFKDVFKSKKTIATFSIVCILAYNNMALNYFTKHYFSSLKSGNSDNSWPMLLIIVVSTILSIVFSGFILEYMKNEISNEEFRLPDFKNNFTYFLKKGFKFMIASLLLWGAFLVVTLVPWLILNKLFFIPFLWNLLLILSLVLCIFLTGLFTASYAEKGSIRKVFSCFNELFLAFKYAPLEILVTFFMCIFCLIVYAVVAELGVFLHYILFFSVIIYSFVCIYNPNLWAQVWKGYKKNYKELKDREDWLKTPD